MELLEGETLADRLAKGPLPLGRGAALRRARSPRRSTRRTGAGIVHRDLKPGNVMLTKAGAKLLDFGLAKSAEERRRRAGGRLDRCARSSTAADRPQGTIVGTFQYMAPEQLEGKEADARTDIFAFGAVLYEMATGRSGVPGDERARA